MYCIIAKCKMKNLTKGAVQSKKKWVRLVFDSFLWHFHACAHLQTHFRISDWLVWADPPWRKTGIFQPLHFFDYLVLKFSFHACILGFFQNVIRSSIDILQGIPNKSDIYFCATGHLMGSGLADVLSSALILTVFCQVNVIVNRFLVGLNELQSPSMLVSCILTHWMGLCVCFQVVQLMLMRKPKQSCLNR